MLRLVDPLGLPRALAFGLSGVTSGLFLGAGGGVAGAGGGILDACTGLRHPDGWVLILALAEVFHPFVKLFVYVESGCCNYCKA